MKLKSDAGLAQAEVFGEISKNFIKRNDKFNYFRTRRFLSEQRHSGVDQRSSGIGR
jgi:hypothetical protein